MDTTSTALESNDDRRSVRPRSLPDLHRFQLLALRHVDAAYNLARWLTDDERGAQDVVQEALLRTMCCADALRDGNVRAWLLQLVHRGCFSRLTESSRTRDLFDDEGADPDVAAPVADESDAVAMRKAERMRVNRAIAALPVGDREVLVLRELEDLSYSDIARIADIPVGTVLSRLACARARMLVALTRAELPALHALLEPAPAGHESAHRLATNRP